MKKAISLFISIVLTMALCACGIENTNEGTDSPAAIEYKVGDTAEGTLFDITVKSAGFVSSIPKGFVKKSWVNSSAGPKQYLEEMDVVPDEGYTLMKIVIKVSNYKGKTNIRYQLVPELDFDNGYSFDLESIKSHASPKLTTGVGISSYYIFPLACSIDIDDPLLFAGVEENLYYAVNQKVQNESEKSLRLLLNIPNSTEDTENLETIVFNLR